MSLTDEFTVRTRHRITTSFLVVLFSGLVCVAIVGQSSLQDGASVDRIHPGDLIEIDELGGFDFDWRGRLTPEGYLDGFTKVSYQIFGRCLTPNQLAKTIEEAYSKTLRDPRVRVRILDRSGRPLVTLDGAIRQPMRLSLRRPLHLNELSVLGGGFTDRASGDITILRPPFQNCETNSETTEVIRVRISDILAGNSSSNARILDGDIVTVQAVEPVYVIGGVARPGSVDWRDGATVSRVVAAAGGVSERGVSGKAVIYRRSRTGQPGHEVDLDKISRGILDDVGVNPFDIVEVPFKGVRRNLVLPAVGPEQRPRQQLPVRVVD